MNDIEKTLDQFLEGKDKNKGHRPDERYASFDFCYNYFSSFHKDNKEKELSDDPNMQMSCMQLGFYLASWGMMRGSSFLLEKSARNYRSLIATIAKMDPQLWEIDVDKYNEKNIDLLLNCRDQIKETLGKEKKPSDTLITKIMLGVFANIPAYDAYFKKFLKEKSYCQTFNKKSLAQIKEFYEQNKNIFDSYKINTFNFNTGEPTSNTYTKAKLIDMYGFITGSNEKEK